MPRSVEELEALLDQALTPGFREKLVSRGLARTLIWVDGKIPEGRTPFAETLSDELLGYGLSLMRACLELRSLDRDNQKATVGFERAAEAIESTVRQGDLEAPERGFYTVLAAASYHLGHFSARSFSLLPSAYESLNLNACEIALVHLLRRDFEALRRQVIGYALPSSFDKALAVRLESLEGSSLLDKALTFSEESLFHRALASFDFALCTGQSRFVGEAKRLLREGADAATDFNAPSFWWIFTVTRHLVDDLWNFSFHVRLPEPKDDPDNSEWTRYRSLYIAKLFRRRRSEIELWPSQIAAAERAINIADDLVAALPTSAGKTRIAEMCILRALSFQQRVVFVTPLRALSAQTERSLKDTFVPLGFTISSLYGSSGSTGDDVDSLINRDVVVSTPEKLDFALRNDPSIFDDVGLVVFDEAHTIGAGEREVRYEVLVQRLLTREDAWLRRIVCLSAILPQGEQLHDFVNWIRQDDPGESINCDWRPTRQQFGEIQKTAIGNTARLTFRVEKEESYVDDFITIKKIPSKLGVSSKQYFGLASVWRLVEEGQSVLLYCPQRDWVNGLAKAATKLVDAKILPPLPTDPEAIRDAVNIGKEWLGAFHPAVRCLEFGVAIHHAHLPKPFLRAVERLLRDNQVRVTIASPTLAQGLNLAANTLLFYGLTNSGKDITGEDFANVAGRAGRAFVDVEGRVLALIETNPQRERWERIREASKDRDIRSGLYQLIDVFIRQVAINKGIPIAGVREHILGNAQGWAAPPLAFFNTKNHESEQLGFEKRWEADIASLDSAILSLVQQDTPAEELAREIDKALQGSLWQRTISHVSQLRGELAREILVGRARFLWDNTDAVQRKGYFFAGVSYKTGKFLDIHADALHASLILANSAFGSDDGTEAGIAALIEFASIIFQIAPFRPEELREDWKELLANWIRGHSLSDLAGDVSSDVIDFIESAFVYRLVWALEAVRVRHTAYSPDDESPHDGLAALAVETGTAKRPAALLIQAGMASRVGATKAVDDTFASFTELRGLRRWLNSPNVVRLQKDPLWPTPETHDLWHQFRAALHISHLDLWDIQAVDLAVKWSVSVPNAGAPVRILHNSQTGKTGIFTVEFEQIGEIASFPDRAKGIFRIEVGKDRLSVVGQYFGPRDLTLSDR